MFRFPQLSPTLFTQKQERKITLAGKVRRKFRRLRQNIPDMSLKRNLPAVTNKYIMIKGRQT